MLLQLIFWTCLWGVLFTYLIYPLFVAVVSRLVEERPSPRWQFDEELPRVTLLIAAYNEEAVIRERLENALALDYPVEKLEILVATDGCSDRTVAIVESFSRCGINLMEFAERRGKSAVLNDAIAAVSGDIAVLSDANTIMEPNAVRQLVHHFQDPNVGFVCGKLCLQDANTGRNVDGLYWRYENWVKLSEARLGALLGANGAIYAMRCSAYCPIPTDTLVDDFTIPLLARLRNGSRTVYEPLAIAVEDTAEGVGAEFRRRSRIGAGGFQSLARLWPILSPKYDWTALAFFSHKFLRWISPFLLAGCLLTNMLLLDEPGFRTMLQLQLLGYFAALLGFVLPRWVVGSRWLRMATLFVEVNFALLVGFGRFLHPTSSGIWTKTDRSSITNIDLARES